MISCRVGCGPLMGENVGGVCGVVWRVDREFVDFLL